MKMEMWMEWRPDRDGVELEDKEGDREGDG